MSPTPSIWIGTCCSSPFHQVTMKTLIVLLLASFAGVVASSRAQAAFAATPVCSVSKPDAARRPVTAVPAMKASETDGVRVSRGAVARAFSVFVAVVAPPLLSLSSSPVLAASVSSRRMTPR